MRPSEVKKLLNCSYASIQNYLTQGKLKLSDKYIKGRMKDYDDSSVYELYDEIFGRKKIDNTVIIGIGNQKFEFKLDKDMVCDILDFINYKLKQRELLKN